MITKLKLLKFKIKVYTWIAGEYKLIKTQRVVIMEYTSRIQQWDHDLFSLVNNHAYINHYCWHVPDVLFYFSSSFYQIVE